MEKPNCNFAYVHHRTGDDHECNALCMIYCVFKDRKEHCWGDKTTIFFPICDGDECILMRILRT